MPGTLLLILVHFLGKKLIIEDVLGIGATRSAIYMPYSNMIIYASDILTANRSTLNSCPRRACADARQSWIKEICEFLKFDFHISVFNTGNGLFYLFFLEFIWHRAFCILYRCLIVMDIWTT